MYFGYSRAAATNGLAVPNFMMVSFNDYLTPEVRKEGYTQATVQLGVGFIGTLPDKRDDSTTGGSLPANPICPGREFAGRMAADSDRGLQGRREDLLGWQTRRAVHAAGQFVARADGSGHQDGSR